jgi:hypothetical protein
VAEENVLARVTGEAGGMTADEEVAVWDVRADEAPEDTTLDWANDAMVINNTAARTGSFFINDSLF